MKEINMSIQLKVDIIPGKPVVRQTSGCLDILVSVAATTLEQMQSAPLPVSLAIVIDRSGSMSDGPLEDAKRVVATIIRGLRPVDRVAIVAYDDKVTIVQPLVHCEDTDSIIAAIMEIFPGGSTNLFGGFEAGADILLASPGLGHNRILLISDGCLNSGLSDPIAIADRVSLVASRGITTSTLGISSHFEEDIMTKMAEAGLGRAHYGQTAADLIDCFKEEIEGLFATQATKVTASLRVLDTSVTAMLLSPEYGPIGMETPLQPLVEGGSSWLLMRVTHGALALGERELLKVSVRAITRTGEEVRSEVSVLAIRVVSDEEEALVPLNGVVRQRLDEFNARRVYNEIRVCIQRGDKAEARRLLDQLEASDSSSAFVRANIETLKELIHQNEQMALKELHYSADRMRSRQMSTPEISAVQNNQLFDSFSPAIPSYVRSKRSVGRSVDPDDNQSA